MRISNTNDLLQIIILYIKHNKYKRNLYKIIRMYYQQIILKNNIVSNIRIFSFFFLFDITRKTIRIEFLI